MALESHAPVEAVAALWTKRRVHFRPSIGELIGYSVLAGIPSVVFGIVAPCAGLVLLGLPLVICFGRYYLCPSVSMNEGTVRVRGWGLLSVETRKREQLGTVTLNPPVKTAAPYTLQLEGSFAALAIPMVTTTYLEARSYAERIAHLLRVDILDKALGRTIRRTRADRFDSPFGEGESADLSIFAKGLDEDPDVLPLRREVHFGTRLLMLVPRFIAIYVAICLIPTVQKPLRPHLKAFSTLLVVSTVAMFAAKRSGVILDRNANVARPWWIHPVRPFYRCLDLDRYLAVVLIRESAPTMSDFRASRYSILLDGFCLPLRLQQTRDLQKAMCEADRVAEFLHLTMVDLTQDAPADRDAKKLEVAAKISPKLFAKPLGPIPQPTRLQLERDGEDFLFVVPSVGLRSHHWVGILTFGGGSSLLMLLVYLCWQNAFRGWRIDVCGIIAGSLLMAAAIGVILLIVFPLFRLGKRAERISVRSDRIAVEVTGTSRQWNAEVHRTDIKDLIVAPGGFCAELVRELRAVAYNEVVRAETKNQSVEFGVGLTHIEKQWLRDAIATILVSDLPKPEPKVAKEEPVKVAATGSEGVPATNGAPGVLDEFIAECAKR